MKIDNFPSVVQEQRTFWISLVVLLVTFLCCANILYFISQAASPLIRDDAWYYLDAVIKPWAQAGANISDLFVKRALDDHPQALNKIALLINFKYFGLDFRYEALIGFLGLSAIILMFAIIYLQKIRSGYPNWISAIAFISAILIIASINVTEIYTWPLVTFNFVTLFLALATSLMAWKFTASESTFGALLLSALFILLIDDVNSIILWLSLSVTVIIFSQNGDQIYRLRAIKWGIATTIFVLCYFALLNLVFLIDAAKSITLQAQSHIHWFDPFFYLDSLRIVFSASLIHVLHFGNYALPASWLVALVVLGFYVRYFVILFTSNECRSREKFLTTFILIYATVSVVAIIYGRVSKFGVDYLNQPRYVFTYQLIPFALTLDFAYSWTRKKINYGIVRGGLFLSAASLFFLMQLVFLIEAYSAVSSISRYYDKQAKAIGNYLVDPSLPPDDCTAYSKPLCQMSVYKRNELLNLLGKEDLNLLNSEFQWKYRLFPLENKSLEPKVLNWGPHTMSATASAVGIWIKLSRPVFDARSALVVRIGSHSVYPVVNSDVVTFTVPAEIATTEGTYSIDLHEQSLSTKVSLGVFEVK